MATKLVMPYLSSKMEQGVLVSWRKREGDPIAKGEIIADVESDRASMTIKSHIQGILLQRFVSEGMAVAVGEPIAIIGERGEALAFADSSELLQSLDDPTLPIPMPKGKRHIIAPSLLSADFAQLKAEIEALEKGGADWLHLDIMDGHFVPNLSFGFPVIKAIRRHAHIPLDVHLMVEAPERYLRQFAEVGADIITVHWEACTHLHRCIQMIKRLRKRVGISLNPHTPVEWLEDILEEIDLVLIMTVNPGFGGQSYLEFCTEKVRKLRSMAKRLGKALDISVDGGIHRDNIVIPAAVGANVFVSGSGILRTSDYGETMRIMKSQLADIQQFWITT